MPRERRPNTVRVRYDRDELIDVLTGQGMLAGYAEAAADLYEARRRAGKDRACQSVVHHGPGHQSTTFCEVTGAPHHDHAATLPRGEYAEWTDDDPFARD